MATKVAVAVKADEAPKAEAKAPEAPKAEEKAPSGKAGEAPQKEVEVKVAAVATSPEKGAHYATLSPGVCNECAVSVLKRYVSQSLRERRQVDGPHEALLLKEDEELGLEDAPPYTLHLLGLRRERSLSNRFDDLLVVLYEPPMLKEGEKTVLEDPQLPQANLAEAQRFVDAVKEDQEQPTPVGWPLPGQELSCKQCGYWRALAFPLTTEPGYDDNRVRQRDEAKRILPDFGDQTQLPEDVATVVPGLHKGIYRVGLHKGTVKPPAAYVALQLAPSSIAAWRRYPVRYPLAEAEGAAEAAGKALFRKLVKEDKGQKKERERLEKELGEKLPRKTKAEEAAFSRAVQEALDAHNEEKFKAQVEEGKKKGARASLEAYAKRFVVTVKGKGKGKSKEPAKTRCSVFRVEEAGGGVRGHYEEESGEVKGLVVVEDAASPLGVTLVLELDPAKVETPPGAGAAPAGSGEAKGTAPAAEPAAGATPTSGATPTAGAAPTAGATPTAAAKPEAGPAAPNATPEKVAIASTPTAAIPTPAPAATPAPVASPVALSTASAPAAPASAVGTAPTPATPDPVAGMAPAPAAKPAAGAPAASAPAVKPPPPPGPPGLRLGPQDVLVVRSLSQGTNMHRSVELEPGAYRKGREVNDFSEGCQVFRSPNEFRTLLRLAMLSKRALCPKRNKSCAEPLSVEHVEAGIGNNMTAYLSKAPREYAKDINQKILDAFEAGLAADDKVAARAAEAASYQELGKEIDKYLKEIFPRLQDHSARSQLLGHLQVKVCAALQEEDAKEEAAKAAKAKAEAAGKEAGMAEAARTPGVDGGTMTSEPAATDAGMTGVDKALAVDGGVTINESATPDAGVIAKVTAEKARKEPVAKGAKKAVSEKDEAARKKAEAEAERAAQKKLEEARKAKDKAVIDKAVQAQLALARTGLEKVKADWLAEARKIAIDAKCKEFSREGIEPCDFGACGFRFDYVLAELTQAEMEIIVSKLGGRKWSELFPDDT